MKSALHWMSPINFDGNPMGAMVRTVEMITVDTVGMALFQSFDDIDCAGPIAIVTLLIMAGQFAVCPRYDVEL